MAAFEEGSRRTGLTRREALLRAFALARLATAGALAAGCRAGPAPKRGAPVRLPLASLPDGGRVVVRASGEPIELRRTGSEIAALSLRCTHWGCTVAWNEREGVYDCPCHDGRYAPDGRVISGPPPRALRVVRVRIDGDAVVVVPRDGEGK